MTIVFDKRIENRKNKFFMSHDNWSKNHLIVLKFGTDVAFIYRQIEFVAPKNWSITTKDMRLKIKKKNYELKTIFGYNFKTLSSFVF